MKKLKTIFKLFFFIILLSSTILVIGATFFLFYCLYDAPKLNLNSFASTNSTTIYDNNNNVVLELGLKKQSSLDLDLIDQDIINATIAIEDARFYEHEGIDYKRIIKATINNIKAGNFNEGASTITQQLIKNIYLSNDKKIKRKIQEFYLAIKLEQNYSKNQILEAYLNNVLYGARIYGVNRACEYYFGHSSTDVSLSEAAFLAGIVQSPNYYNPYLRYEECLSRRNLVLYMMKYHHFISNEEYKQAIEEPIILSNRIQQELYAAYLYQVILEAKENYGLNALTDGLKIYTNLDITMQKQVEDTIKSDLYLKNNMQAGIVCIDNKTGKIEAIGGMKENELGLNYATNVNLQPGSTIKPILDFGPAFEYLNYGSGNIILDEKYFYKNGIEIKNWDKLYRGYITIRQALSSSRNIPAVKLFNEVGYERAFSFASKLGITLKSPALEANSLGGFTYGYSVLEMTNAYQAFANMGEYHEGLTIDYIIHDDQKLEYKKSHIAMKKETAFLINDILHDVVKNSSYNLSGMYLCAKTGQTNYDYKTRLKYNIPEIGTKDSWFIGYSKEKTIGVWVGFDKLYYQTYLDNSEKDIPRYIWKDLMSKYSSYQYLPYPMPNNLVKVLIERNNEIPYLATSFSTNTSYEYFLIGTEPHQYKKKDEILSSP